MKKIVLIPFILVLFACSTLQEMDWFASSSKKLEGNRINAFADSLTTEGKLEIASYPTLDLGNITSIKLAHSANNIYFNGNFAYYITNNRVIKLDISNVESQPIFEIPKVIKADRVLFASDEEIILNDGVNLFDYSFRTDTARSIFVEIPVKSNIIEVRNGLKCFQDIAFNLKCFNNEGVFTLLFEDIGSDVVAKNRTGIATLGGIVFFSSKDGIVRAIDVDSRNLLWEYNSAHKFDISGQIFYNLSFGPKLFGSNLIFANYANGIYGIDINTGAEKFRNSTREIINASVSGNYVIANTASGGILVLDQSTGQSYNMSVKLDKSETIKLSYIHMGQVMIFTSKGKIITLDLTNKGYYDKSDVIIDLRQDVADAVLAEDKILLVLSNSILIINKK